MKRATDAELVLARERPGVVADALLERWLRDPGARAVAGWERLVVDLGRAKVIRRPRK